MTKLTAAFAAIGLFALPSMAGAEAGRETVAVSVSTASAGLGRDQRIENRITRAISKACETGDNDLKARLSPDWRCRAEMRHDAMTKLAARRQVGGSQIAAVAPAVVGLN